ncbi:hypothetical protein PQU92_02890 [Asticcacaulis sp. BYS171W]|uniref:DUF4375 domain-containing protein n=1 Tax=Asticcacaulis aquaticus TaxID=2984212 RepID=A0ABT5HQV6_9CAUL|nr:hypothetical protein [Asticcacaulis aquaticus]MDC7682205.1 hypothetical protein [Asticcacaulis aquaticus]
MISIWQKWFGSGAKPEVKPFVLVGDEAELPDEVYVALAELYNSNNALGGESIGTLAEVTMSRVAVFHRCFLNGAFGATLVSFADALPEIIDAYNELSLNLFSKTIEEANAQARAAIEQGVSSNDIEHWYALFEEAGRRYSDLTYGGKSEDAEADKLEQALVRLIRLEPEAYRNVLLEAGK